MQHKTTEKNSKVKSQSLKILSQFNPITDSRNMNKKELRKRYILTNFPEGRKSGCDREKKKSYHNLRVCREGRGIKLSTGVGVSTYIKITSSFKYLLYLTHILGTDVSITFDNVFSNDFSFLC